MSDAVIQFDGRQQVQELALSLVQQARRRVCFFGAQLDPVLFDNTDLIDSLTEFSLRTPRARAQFIVHDSRAATSQGHRLVPLLQKLTSQLQLKVTCQQHQTVAGYFMLVDNQGYLYGPQAAQYHGRACFDDMAETKRLGQLFDTLWEQGEVDTMTRRLYL